MDLNSIPETEQPVTINDFAQKSLIAVAKWAKFIAIVGFVGCGLMILFALFGGTIFSSVVESRSGSIRKIGGIGMFVSYTLAAVLYFFPCLYLYQFAAKTQYALQSKNDILLGYAFHNLKKMFQFLGVMIAILFTFYLVNLGFALLLGKMAGRA